MTDDPDRRPGPLTLWGGWTSTDHATIHEAFTRALTLGATWGWRGGARSALQTTLAPTLQLWGKQAPALFDPATFPGQMVRGGVAACGEQGYDLGLAAAEGSPLTSAARATAPWPAALRGGIARAADTAWATACDLWTLPGGAHVLATGAWLPTAVDPIARTSEWLIDPLTGVPYRLTQSVADVGPVHWTRTYRGTQHPPVRLAPEDLSVLEALIIGSWATSNGQATPRRVPGRSGRRVMG